VGVAVAARVSIAVGVGCMTTGTVAARAGTVAVLLRERAVMVAAATVERACFVASLSGNMDEQAAQIGSSNKKITPASFLTHNQVTSAERLRLAGPFPHGLNAVETRADTSGWAPVAHGGGAESSLPGTDCERFVFSRFPRCIESCSCCHAMRSLAQPNF